jgi:hypothetical protein
MQQQNEEQIANECVEVVSDVWDAIDWDGVSANRRAGIYGELQGKMTAAARCRNLREFHSRLCAKFGVRATFGKDRVSHILGQGDCREHLDMIRRESQYLIMLLRSRNEQRKEAHAAHA